MKEEFFYNSRDNKTRIHAVRWIPEGRPCGVLQIVHGMAEYADRYSRLAEYLNTLGILVTANDHLGHGQSLAAGSPYGYFCHEDAPDVLVEDVHRLRLLTRKEYPGLPYYMMGHSMGSFILRNYLCAHADGLAGAVVMGTGMQPKWLLGFSLMLCRMLTVIQGGTHPSGLLNTLAFGTYNRRIRHPRSAMDWLSGDPAEVAKYNADPLCGFTFTLNGFQTLFTLIYRLYDEKRLARMPRDLPVLVISGREDPVGGYGKAVKKVYLSYKQMGMKHISLELYPEGRHELVNETYKERVWKDLGRWIMKQIGQEES